MRKLILIALIFSLQILQGQVSIEKVWEELFYQQQILTISNSSNDSSLYVIYNAGGMTPEPTNMIKLDPFSLKRSNPIRSYYFGKVFLNNNGQPFAALGSTELGKSTLCFIDTDKLFDKLNCIEGFHGSSGNFSNKNNQLIIYYQRMVISDTLIKFRIYNLSDINNFLDYQIKLDSLNYSDNIHISMSQDRMSFVIFSSKFNETLNNYISSIDIYNLKGEKVRTLENIGDYQIANMYKSKLFYQYSNNNLLFFNNKGLVKLNLTTLETTEIANIKLSKIANIEIAKNEKFLIVSSDEGLNYVDLENNEISSLSNERFSLIEIANSNNYFYGIKQGEFSTLYKYRIKTPNSINEENEPSLSISPNPTSDFINIAGIDPETRIELTNILGELVWYGIGAKQISTQALPNGTYFLKTTKGSQVKSQKVLVWR